MLSTNDNTPRSEISGLMILPLTSGHMKTQMKFGMVYRVCIQMKFGMGNRVCIHMKFGMVYRVCIHMKFGMGYRVCIHNFVMIVYSRNMCKCIARVCDCVCECECVCL